jgi:hypothetical protein
MAQTVRRPSQSHFNAAIKAAPVFGAKLKSFDAAKVASMRGVKKGRSPALPGDTYRRRPLQRALAH